MTLNELIEKAHELDIDFDKIITIHSDGGGVDIQRIEKSRFNGLIIKAY